MSVILKEPKRPGFRGRPGNPKNCQKCLARTRRGTACQCPAERNPVTGLRKRCRRHGGLSTGPSPEGRARLSALRTKHGRYTKQAKEERKVLQKRLKTLKAENEASK
jgi:hypothetical protein